MSEVKAVKTPITPFALQQAYSALPQKLGAPAIELLVAHSALETGFWASCYNYNLGNVKGNGPSGNYCMRECGEELPAKFVDPADPLVKVVRRYERNGVPYVSAVFQPPHSQCHFAAFDSLQQAAQEKVLLLQKQFPKSWATLANGNAKAYGICLAAEHYFTADPQKYSDSLAQVLTQVRAKGLWWRNDPDPYQEPGEKIVSCCKQLLIPGPIGEAQRPDIYRSFINAEQWPAGYLLQAAVGTIEGWRTSCALFVRAVLYWCGRKTIQVAHNASGIFAYLGLDYSHPAWVPNNGKNSPKPGDIFYKSGTKTSNDGHVGIFLEGGSAGTLMTAEGGHGDGTTCELSSMTWGSTHRDTYGRTVWGWWDCSKLLPAALVKPIEVSDNPGAQSGENNGDIHLGIPPKLADKPKDNPNQETANETSEHSGPLENLHQHESDNGNTQAPTLNGPVVSPGNVGVQGSPTQKSGTSVANGEQHENADSQPDNAHDAVIPGEPVNPAVNVENGPLQILRTGDAKVLLVALFGAAALLVTSILERC